MTDNIDTPEFKKDGFICPKCHKQAHQHWQALTTPMEGYTVTNAGISQCNRCRDVALWFNKKLVYPTESTAPSVNVDCPKEIKPFYEQARNVLQLSPIASCALLRLVIEKIIDSIVEGNDSLNAKIGKLVGKGLDERIQQALDSVRVIGDNAVHPLYMDLKDDEPTARKLFDLVNIIVSSTISTDKKIKDVFSGLPDPAKKQITERDKSKK